MDSSTKTKHQILPLILCVLAVAFSLRSPLVPTPLASLLTNQILRNVRNIFFVPGFVIQRKVAEHAEFRKGKIQTLCEPLRASRLGVKWVWGNHSSLVPTPLA